MPYAINCVDKADALELRLETREAHLEYVTKFREASKLIYAKPMLSEAGDMIGSLIILDALDRAEAEAFSANDPYTKAGLFAEVTITKMAE